MNRFAVFVIIAGFAIFALPAIGYPLPMHWSTILICLAFLMVPSKRRERRRPKSKTAQKLEHYLTIGALALTAFLLLGMFVRNRSREAKQNSPEAVQQRELAQKEGKDRKRGYALRDEASELLYSYEDGTSEDQPNLQEVLAKIDESITLIDGDNSSHFIRACVLLYLDRMDEAEVAFKTHIQLGGNRVHYVEILRDQKKYELALKAVDQLLEKKQPCEPSLLKVQLLLDLKKEREAYNLFQKLGSCGGDLKDELEPRVKEIQVRLFR